MERETDSHLWFLHWDSQGLSDVFMHRNTATLIYTKTRTPLYSALPWLGAYNRVTKYWLRIGRACFSAGNWQQKECKNSGDVAPSCLFVCEHCHHFSKRCSMAGLMNEKPEKALWSMESMKFLSLWDRRGFSLRNSLSKLLQSLAAFCTWTYKQQSNEKRHTTLHDYGSDGEVQTKM